eukprot:SAG11_NODE_2056_length_3877_cov_2.744574_2_plen_177_part_00
MRSLLLITLQLLAGATVATAAADESTFPQHLAGDTAAVYALLERILPGSSAHFALDIGEGDCPDRQRKPCFTIMDTTTADYSVPKTKVVGTTASEVTAGIGIYLREVLQHDHRLVARRRQQHLLPLKLAHRGLACVPFTRRPVLARDTGVLPSIGWRSPATTPSSLPRARRRFSTR